ncbi:MAG: ABC transporter permease [Parachlamydia sp.]|nr:MAG: ABC transporter permease [Parachlamydia sp.]
MDDSFFNPYSNNTFLEFFSTLFFRIGAFVSGKLPLKELANDEIQLIVLICIASSTALIGCFLTLRKMTMLANSLSHTILLGIVGAYFLSARLSDPQTEGISMPIEIMLLAALVMGFITTFLTEFLTKTLNMQEDASTGIVFTTLFALGIVLVTLLTRNAHIGTEIVMGNADILRLEDSYGASLILLIDLFFIWRFFKEFKITTFDPALSQALGISPAIFNYLLMSLVSITIIGAFRAIGVLMVLSFITGPPLTARFLTDKLRNLLILSVAIGAFACLIGVALSRHFLSVYNLALSTGGIVVCVVALFFILSLLYQTLKPLLTKTQSLSPQNF